MKEIYSKEERERERDMREEERERDEEMSKHASIIGACMYVCVCVCVCVCEVYVTFILFIQLIDNHADIHPFACDSFCPHLLIYRYGI